jgi:hypothetical protein
MIEELPEDEVPAVLGAARPASAPEGTRRGRQPGSAPPRAGLRTRRPDPGNCSAKASAKPDHQRTQAHRSCWACLSGDGRAAARPGWSWCGPGQVR